MAPGHLRPLTPDAIADSDTLLSLPVPVIALYHEPAHNLTTRAADMVGNQVTVAVARRRAEPGDLIYMCAATRIARRPDLHDERTVPG